MKHRILFAFESKLLLGNKINLAIIVVFFCAKFVISWLSAIPSDDVLYREYMTRFSGIYTVEKEVELQEEQARLRAVFDREIQMYEAYVQDRISREEYEAYTEAYADAEARLQILPEIVSQMEYLKRRENEAQALRSHDKTAEQASYTDVSRLTAFQLRGYERPAEMFDSKGWERYIGGNNFDFLLYALMLMLLVPYFSRDYETGMIALINTSKHSVSIKSLRIVLSLFLCTGLVVAFGALDYVIYAARLGLPDGAAPIQSLAAFASYAGVMSLQTMLHSSLLFRLLGTAALVLITYGLAEVLQNAVFVTLCYFLLVFFPHLDHLTLGLIPGAARRFLFSSVLSGSTLFSEADVLVIMGFPVLSVAVSGVFFFVLYAGASWWLWKRSKRCAQPGAASNTRFL
jgi:hypothetical protein